MRRYIFVILACFGTVVLTGASPIADLLARVEALEAESQTLGGQVASLETENQALSGKVASVETENQMLGDQVASLESESHKQPVVIDANGVEVGTVVHFESTVVRLLFEFEGIPPFLLDLEKDGLLHQTAGANTGSVVFETTDCSGIGFLLVQQPTLGLAPALYARGDGGGRTFLNQASGEEIITYRSALHSRGNCAVGGLTTPGYARAIPVLEMEDFTPPFHIVTRGDLLAGE